MSAVRNRWVMRPRPTPAAATRGFAFPHAGGGASSFRTLAHAVPPDVELVAVQLPGREARLAEAPLIGPRSIAEAALEGLGDLFDRPFALLGHSAGALVAYELARLLSARGRPPRLLVVSAHQAPHAPWLAEPSYHLPEAEFLGMVERYGGLPAEVLANRELVELVLPSLRADFESNECYVHDGSLGRAGCPVLAIRGDDDTSVARSEMDAWREHADGGFRLASLAGGHFPHLEPVGAASYAREIMAFLANVRQSQ